MEEKQAERIFEGISNMFYGSAGEDPLKARIELQEKMLSRSMLLSLGGSLASYFLGLQTIILLFRITGDIQWSWLVVPVPTFLFIALWYGLNWVRRQKAERMITEVKKGIDEMKGSLGVPTNDEDSMNALIDLVNDIKNGSKKDSV